MTIKDQYTTFTAEMTVMSPMFIGSGEELNKTKYYFNQKDMTVKIVDDKKLRQFLAKNNLFESFQQHLMDNGNKGNIFRWLLDNKIDIKSTDLWKYTLEAKNLRKKDEKKDTYVQLNKIKTFVKNANGKPYIPGSSLKGAIRTALLYLELVENKEKYSENWSRISRLRDGKEIKKSLEKEINLIEEDVFGKTQNSLFKALIVSDSIGLDYSNLYIGQRADFPIHKDKISIMPIQYEFLSTGSKLSFTVTIDKNLDNNNYFSKERIKKALDGYAKLQNKLYDEFAYKDNDSVYMPDEISDNIMPNICIGGSAGFWSKSIVYALAPSIQSAIDILRPFFSYQFDRGKRSHKHNELDIKVSPHAMKLVEEKGDFIPIGWARLELVEKEIKE